MFCCLSAWCMNLKRKHQRADFRCRACIPWHQIRSTVDQMLSHRFMSSSIAPSYNVFTPQLIYNCKEFATPVLHWRRVNITLLKLHRNYHACSTTAQCLPRMLCICTEFNRPYLDCTEFTTTVLHCHRVYITLLQLHRVYHACSTTAQSLPRLLCNCTEFTCTEFTRPALHLQKDYHACLLLNRVITQLFSYTEFSTTFLHLHRIYHAFYTTEFEHLFSKQLYHISSTPAQRLTHLKLIIDAPVLN